MWEWMRDESRGFEERRRLSLSERDVLLKGVSVPEERYQRRGRNEERVKEGGGGSLDVMRRMESEEEIKEDETNGSHV